MGLITIQSPFKYSIRISRDITISLYLEFWISLYIYIYISLYHNQLYIYIYTNYFSSFRISLDITPYTKQPIYIHNIYINYIYIYTFTNIYTIYTYKPWPGTRSGDWPRLWLWRGGSAEFEAKPMGKWWQLMGKSWKKPWDFTTSINLHIGW